MADDADRDIASPPGVYQLRVVLAGISPLIWRRLLVPAQTTIAGLHSILQTVFGWGGEHLHRAYAYGTNLGPAEVARHMRGKVSAHEIYTAGNKHSDPTKVYRASTDVITGEAGAVPVILLHGFPYDVRAFDDVGAFLARRGAFVVAPYLRGFGPTCFRNDTVMRSGQQGALAQDVLKLMDALDIGEAVLAGYDWGGRAARITAALHPDRVRGLLTVDGYNIQDLACADEPVAPAWERT